MKIYYKMALMIPLVLAMSCDFGKNRSPDHGTEGRTVPENKEITNTTNYKSSGNFDIADSIAVGNDKIADSLNENWNLDNPKRKEHLYTSFNMTQDQIQRYEEALQDWKESEQEDAYKLLSAGAKIKQEDKILKNILDDSQYERYREWASRNDLRR